MPSLPMAEPMYQDKPMNEQDYIFDIFDEIAVEESWVPTLEECELIDLIARALKKLT